MKYYAIKDETHKVITETWEEALSIIKECKAPKYKSFSIKEEALAYLNDEEYSDGVTEPKAYIDGSFNSKTSVYGFGAILIIDNKEYIFKKGYEEIDEYTENRNVAGEIKAAGFIINYAFKQGIKRLHIFYDYQGIESWYTKEWKANTKIAQEYAKFSDNMNGKIEVVFHKVKSHTNNKYNDKVDKLAKEAVGM